MVSTGMSIRQSNQSFATFAEQPYVGEMLKPSVLSADILLVPNDGYCERDLVFFPSGTSNFYKFLKQGAPEGVSVEAACDEEAYQEVGRHVDILHLAEVIVKTAAVPIFVALVTEYIKRKIWKEGKQTTLKTAITVLDQQKGRSVQMIYEGPADKFRETALDAFREIQNPSKSEENLLHSGSDHESSD